MKAKVVAIGVLIVLGTAVAWLTVGHTGRAEAQPAQSRIIAERAVDFPTDI